MSAVAQTRAVTFGSKAANAGQSKKSDFMGSRVAARMPVAPKGGRAGARDVTVAVLEADRHLAVAGPLYHMHAAGNDVNARAYFEARTKAVTQHFGNAIGQEDFMARVEVGLAAHGFNGHNSIAMSNFCRDEITASLKDKVEAVFGNSFNTNGLGGVLTCGTIGMNAGLSHAPQAQGTGKERYVFFAFPHIAIDSTGELGAISRPGRPGVSCACGAMAGALNLFKTESPEKYHTQPGDQHDPMNPEFSILVHRLARRLTSDDMPNMDLADITKVCEMVCSDDLEQLISEVVDTDKADYAVITGVQIHSWATDYFDHEPNLEFVAPALSYVVVDGVKTDINLFNIPAPTPRQLVMLTSDAHHTPTAYERLVAMDEDLEEDVALSRYLNR